MANKFTDEDRIAEGFEMEILRLRLILCELSKLDCLDCDVLDHCTDIVEIAESLRNWLSVIQKTR